MEGPASAAAAAPEKPLWELFPGVVPEGVTEGPGLPPRGPAKPGIVPLRPVMHGKVVFKPPRVSISGKWAGQEHDSVWSPFAYRSTAPVILPAEVTPTSPPIDMEATGHFMVSIQRPGAPAAAATLQRCNETSMRIRIGGPVWPEAKPAERPADKPDAPIVGVRGDGRNKFGTFRIVGSFCPASSAIWMLKVYTGTAEDSKIASREAARRARGVPLAAGRSPRATAKQPRAVALKLSSTMQRCLAITRHFLNDSRASALREPVDPVRDHCPNYFSVIKEPMDLSTVASNIAAGKYPGHEEWAKDMALIFTNAATFNPATHWLHQTAKALHTDFRDRYSKLVEAELAGPAAAASATKGGRAGARGGQRRAAAKAQRLHAAAARAHADEDYDGAAARRAAPAPSQRARREAAATARKGGRTKRARAPDAYDDANGDADDDDESLDLGLESDDDDGMPRRRAAGRPKRQRPAGDLRRENAVLHTQLSDMQQQMEQMQSMMSQIISAGGDMSAVGLLAPMPQAAAPAPARRRRSADAGARPLSVAEQKQLKVDWDRLTDDQERHALDIIAQSMPIDDDMSELDLKDVDPKTLRAVQRYVASCLGKPVKGGKGRGRKSGGSSSSSASASAARRASAPPRDPDPLPPPMPVIPVSAPAPAPAVPAAPPAPMPVMAGGPVPALIEEDWEGLDDDEDDNPPPAGLGGGGGLPLDVPPPASTTAPVVDPLSSSSAAAVSASAPTGPSGGPPAGAVPGAPQPGGPLPASPATLGSTGGAGNISAGALDAPPQPSSSSSSSAAKDGAGAAQDALLQGASARRDAELRAQEAKSRAEEEEAARRQQARAAEEEARRKAEEARAAEEAARRKAEEEAAARLEVAKAETAAQQRAAAAAATADDDEDDEEDDAGAAAAAPAPAGAAAGEAGQSSSSSSGAAGGFDGAGAFGGAF